MKKKKGKRKTIFEMYEPAELEMRHFTEQDNEIRNTDIPERMQLRNFPVRFVFSFFFNAAQLYAGRVQVMMEFVCCHAKASSDKP